MLPAIVISGSSPRVCDMSLHASPGHWNQCAPRQLRFRGNPYEPHFGRRAMEGVSSSCPMDEIIKDIITTSLCHTTGRGSDRSNCDRCQCGHTRNPNMSGTKEGSRSVEANQHTLRTDDNDAANKTETLPEKQIQTMTDTKEENIRDSTGDVTLDALLEHVFGNLFGQSFGADPEDLVKGSTRGSECCGSENSAKCTSDGCPRTQATDKSSLLKATEKDSDQEQSIEPSDTTSSRSDTAAEIHTEESTKEPLQPEISSQNATDHYDVSLEVSNAVSRDHDQEYEFPQHSPDAKCVPSHVGCCLDKECRCPEGSCPSNERQLEADIDAGHLKEDATKEEAQHQSLSDHFAPFRVTFDLSQFAPEEIQVKLSDRKLIIDAKHESVDNGLVIQDVMHKAVTLPPTVDPDSLRCLLADKGHLTITGDRLMLRNQDKVLTIEV